MKRRAIIPVIMSMIISHGILEYFLTQDPLHLVISTALVVILTATYRWVDQREASS